ncbi:MAG: dihydropteroate synthase [Lachnospiraceae bacterium]|nr:dihydropteroate synthase [Lachnospiraceae bacterium]
MKIGNREFDLKNQTYIMGILNVTPDSFSDGGKFHEMDKALFHAEEMMRDGAAIIDVGGESTRPGYTVVPDEEEIERVVPIIEGIKSRLDIPVSLDTYKSNVARAGIRAGADLINDIWGLKYDEKLAGVIAESGLPCCLMHNRKEPDYTDYLQDVLMDLSETVRLAEEAGIEDTKIILDPGVGFGKTYENNLEIIRYLEELHAFGYPILLGTSRKSVIGLTLNLPAKERVEGTLVTTVFGVIKGCSIIRVHDVKENVRAVRMARAILGKGVE